jgi:uncharacterized protein YjbI with pentapeptide repeats
VSWFGLWHWYSANATVINPIATFVGALGAFATAAALAWAGIKNARTAARRHEEQTKADRQRRITESFSKATEQLASEKIEARLGGIYTLERISRESPDDYRVVMETLTAFVREHARWKERDKFVNLYYDEPEPATDIAAVLTVIDRRDFLNPLNRAPLWDFRGCDLRGANLVAAHLEGAFLWGTHLEGAGLDDAHLEEARLDDAHLEGARLEDAHLEGASLVAAHLERARLEDAHLERACLIQAHLEGAILVAAHLEGALLVAAHLERANFSEAHLEGADLATAHLEGADLATAKGLTPDQISQAFGDRETILPQGLTRPEHWAQRGAGVAGI